MAKKLGVQGATHIDAASLFNFAAAGLISWKRHDIIVNRYVKQRDEAAKKDLVEMKNPITLDAWGQAVTKRNDGATRISMQGLRALLIAGQISDDDFDEILNRHAKYRHAERQATLQSTSKIITGDLARDMDTLVEIGTTRMKPGALTRENVREALGIAYNMFVSMPDRESKEKTEFCELIHLAQDFVVPLSWDVAFANAGNDDRVLRRAFQAYAGPVASRFEGALIDLISDVGAALVEIDEKALVAGEAEEKPAKDYAVGKATVCITKQDKLVIKLEKAAYRLELLRESAKHNPHAFISIPSRNAGGKKTGARFEVPAPTVLALHDIGWYALSFEYQAHVTKVSGLSPFPGEMMAMVGEQATSVTLQWLYSVIYYTCGPKG